MILLVRGYYILMIFPARMAESIFLYTDVTYLDKLRSPSHPPGSSPPGGLTPSSSTQPPHT
jgi:hypothetical protein